MSCEKRTVRVWIGVPKQIVGTFPWQRPMKTIIANSAYRPCEINLRFAYNGSGRVARGKLRQRANLLLRGGATVRRSQRYLVLGFDDDGDARRHRHFVPRRPRLRIAAVPGMQPCVRRAKSAAVVLTPPSAGPYYPCYCADPWYCDDGWDLDVDPPHPPGSPRRYRSTSLSKVPYHPRNQGVSNVLP